MGLGLFAVDLIGRKAEPFTNEEKCALGILPDMRHKILKCVPRLINHGTVNPF
ncbi:MAG: hypothetical protein IH989_07270 [Planctomycetes bacterium]|nr:hypothetical protein [Planctomycetota bacterium]